VSTAAAVLPAGMEIMDNFTINRSTTSFGQSIEYPRDLRPLCWLD